MGVSPASPIALDSMFPAPLEEVGALAQRLEQLGFEGLWTNETPHDPYLPLLAAALATDKMTIGTGVATAFTRSPMVTALSAWDLQRASAGRFVLGLGTQVKAHNARRYSTPVEEPGAQMRELVELLRHVWGAFQGDHPLDFHGRFYDLDLLTPVHSPGPIEHPEIPIYLSAVRSAAFRRAGEIADGVHVHSFHTPEYLRQLSLPALQEGLDRAGRGREDMTLVCALFAVIGGDPQMDRAVRSQIAFYGSTSSYREVFELHGWGELSERLKPSVRAGDIDAMVAAIDDEVVAEFAIVAADWNEAAEIVHRRYDGLLDRVGFYAVRQMVDPAEAAGLAHGFAARAPVEPVQRPSVAAWPHPIATQPRRT
jgi:probable F420-dependent oxidoreductase